METLGEHLKRRREEQGITLEDIESVTKIGLAYLRDMEEDRFENLPASIFTLGFLKQYAQCVGLDPQAVLLRYRLEVCKQGDGSPEGMRGKPWRMRRRAIWILLGLLGGLILLWLFLSPGDKGPEERVRSILLPRTTERELKKQRIREELDLGAGVMLPKGGGAEEGAQGGNVPGARIAPADRGPVAVTLQALRGTRVTWTLDGEPPRSRVLRPGERVSWEAEDSLRLEIGNGDAVRIFYRGDVYEPLGRRGEVVHIAFPPPSP